MTTDTALAERTVPAFALQRVSVKQVIEVSPTYRRVVFTGDEVRHIADNRRDQRIKLVLARPGRTIDDMPTGENWYPEWRELADEVRPYIRTYTIREVRAELDEFDVDIALHGRIGPASSWAIDARVGDEIVVCVPDGRFAGVNGGVDWHAPDGVDRVLLVGDETALPAIAGILETLPSRSRGIVVVEVPDVADAAALGACPDGIEVRVFARGHGVVGSVLDPAARAAAEELCGECASSPTVLDDVDVDAGLLWEAPTDATAGSPLYAWLAGEAGVIKGLRRHLVGTLGIDRRAVAFMGYWREGRADED